MNAGRVFAMDPEATGKQRVAVLQEEIHMIHHANELYWRHTKPSDADGRSITAGRIGWRRFGASWLDCQRNN